MPERDTAVDIDDDFEARTATLRAWLDGETVDAHDVGVEMQDWMSFFGFYASPQHRAAAWHTRRFPAAQPYHVALKAMEELGELAEVLNGVLSGGRDSEATSRRGSVPDEAVEYWPADRRRRDPDNLVPGVLKPVVDGLVDAGVIVDDTAAYVVRDMPVIHPPREDRRPRWLLTVTAVEG